MLRIFTTLFILVAVFCDATDLKPWFGNEYEAEIRATALYQNYTSLATTCPHCPTPTENDIFMTLSAAYPFKRYCGEFEATAAHTTHQNCRWDNFRITGRYQWMDEVDGDGFSMVSGLTLMEPFSRALHDVSSFHHGHLEAELTLSFGKKYGFPCSKDYVFRWWEVVGVGYATNSAFWMRWDAACEYNLNDTHQFRGLLNALWGLGDQRLQPRNFKGYGYVAHRSLDVGVRYGYATECWGTLSIQYARRVYASNFPRNNNLVLLEYYFPFGSQPYTSY